MTKNSPFEETIVGGAVGPDTICRRPAGLQSADDDAAGSRNQTVDYATSRSIHDPAIECKSFLALPVKFVGDLNFRPLAKRIAAILPPEELLPVESRLFPDLIVERDVMVPMRDGVK